MAFVPISELGLAGDSLPTAAAAGACADGALPGAAGGAFASRNPRLGARRLGPVA